MTLPHITFRGTIGGRPWANVIAIGPGGPSLPANPATLASLASTSWDTNISINTPLSVTLEETEAWYGPYDSAINGQASQGKLTGEAVPPQVCALLNKVTPGGVPAGRLYHAGLRETDVDSDGNIDPVWCVQLQTAYASIVTDLGLNDITVGIQSKIGPEPENYYVLEAPYFVCQGKVATQRRRIR